MINFNGERTEEGILKFLKENTSHPWIEIDGEDER